MMLLRSMPQNPPGRDRENAEEIIADGEEFLRPESLAGRIETDQRWEGGSDERIPANRWNDGSDHMPVRRVDADGLPARESAG